MSDKPDNNKEFHGINPHESLVRSLESIKSLLQQGDSKILKARESIARASVLSKDAVKDRFNEPHISTFTNNKNTEQHSTTSKNVDPLYDHELVPMLDDIVIEDDSVDENSSYDDSLITDKIVTEEIIIDSKQSTPDNNETNDELLEDNKQPLNSDNNDAIIFQDNIEEEFKPDADFEKMIDKMLNDADDSDPIEIPELEIDKSPISTSSINNIVLSKEKENEIEHTYDEIVINEQQHKQTSVTKDENKSSTVATPAAEVKNPSDDLQVKQDTVNDKITTSNQKKIIDKVNLSLVESLTEEKIDNDKKLDPVVIKETTPGTSQAKKSTKIDTIVEFDNDELKTIISDIDKSKINENKIDKSNSHDNTEQPQAKTDSDSDKHIVAPQQDKSDDSILMQLQNDPDGFSFNPEQLMTLQKRVEKRIHNRLIQIIVQLDGDIHSIFKEEMDKCLQKYKDKA